MANDLCSEIVVTEILHLQKNEASKFQRDMDNANTDPINSKLFYGALPKTFSAITDILKSTSISSHNSYGLKAVEIAYNLLESSQIDYAFLLVSLNEIDIEAVCLKLERKLNGIEKYYGSISKKLIQDQNQNKVTFTFVQEMTNFHPNLASYCLDWELRQNYSQSKSKILTSKQEESLNGVDTLQDLDISSDDDLSILANISLNLMEFGKKCIIENGTNGTIPEEFETPKCIADAGLKKDLLLPIYDWQVPVLDQLNNSNSMLVTVTWDSGSKSDLKILKQAWEVVASSMEEFNTAFCFTEADVFRVKLVNNPLNWNIVEENSDLRTNCCGFSLVDGPLYEVRYRQGENDSLKGSLLFHPALMMRHRVFDILKNVDLVYSSLINKNPLPIIEMTENIFQTSPFELNNPCSQNEVEEIISFRDKNSITSQTISTNSETLVVEYVDALRKVCLEYNITLDAILIYSWHKILKAFGRFNETIIDSEHGPYYFEHNLANEDIAINEIIQVHDSLNAMKNCYSSGNKYSNVKIWLNKIDENLTIIKNLRVGRILPQTHWLDVELNYNETHIEQTIHFNSKYIDSESMEATCKTFASLLSNIALSPNKPLSYLSSVEKYQVIEKWNSTDTDKNYETTLKELFEIQVEKTPNKKAVVFEGVSLTYNELNERANQVCRALIESGLKPGEYVGLFFERSELMIMAIYGIIKAGLAYVPLEPSYPEFRLKLILNECKPRVVLTNKNFVEAVKDLSDVKVISVEETIGYSKANSIVGVNPDHPAYLLFSSGTTGKPKGIAIRQRGICNRCIWMNSKFPLKSEDKYIQKTPFSFDVSCVEFFWTLCFGECLVVAKPNGHMDVSYLVNVIEKEQVSKIHFVPSMLNAFETHVRINKLEEKLESLSHIFCSGEEFPIGLVQRVKDMLPFIHLHNLYGPTEASVDVLEYDLTPSIQKVYIGRPISNTKVYVLDDNLQPLPVMAVGNLYVGGSCPLAIGYLNNPVLTATKFIPNVFVPGQLMYNTNDLCRWTKEGYIEFFGRSDTQIKVRGFRIELGEIQSCMLKFCGIDECAVVAKDRGEGVRFLVGYYIASNSIDKDMLKEHLETELPEYMVPPFLVKIAKMPVTMSGKLDEKSLPMPEEDYDILKYDEPENLLEAEVRQIWSESLQIPENKLGVLENIYRIGDSLTTIHILAKIRQKFGVVITINELFDDGNIRNLCKRINSLANETVSEIIPEEVEKEFLCNALQTGFIFHSVSHDSKDDAYIVQNIWDYNCSLDIEILIKSWKNMMLKHPSLKLRFSWDDKLLQIIDEEAELDFRVLEFDVDCNRDSEIRKILAFDKLVKYDLTMSPLFRVYLLKFSATAFTCILSNHHAIMDGISTEILISNLHSHYFEIIEDKDKTVATDYSYPISQEFKGRTSDLSNEFWKDYLQGVEPGNDLYGLVEPGQNISRIEEIKVVQNPITIQWSLIPELLTQLKKVAQVEMVTLNSILNYTWHKCLSVFGRRNQTVVGTVVSGRSLPIENIENSVGLFINTLPLVLVHKDGPVLETIRKIQNDIFLIHDHSNVNLAKLQSDGQRLFESLYVYTSSPRITESLEASKLGITKHETFQKEDYPLALEIIKSQTNLNIRLTYEGAVFPEANMNRLVDTFQTILKSIARNPKLDTKELHYMSTDEEEKVLHCFNRTESQYSKNMSVGELFDQRVKENSNSNAVIYEGGSITFSELNDRAKKIAAWINEVVGDTVENLVGTFFDEVELLPESVFGILKSGNAHI